jgi:D-arginine dehydrogenase
VRTNSAVKSINKTSKGWTLCTAQGEIDAAIVVNAGGAWADVLGDMAGAERIGLIPKRRTAVIVDAPEGCDISVLPLTVDVQEQFYLKPEAGKLLISPANEDPESPCDVQPDEMDIAICVDRIEQAFDISVRRIERSWAGLRSFVADKCPVAGFSAQVEGFYWLAGQGGYGIQSAPALAEYAAAKILGLEVPQHILAEGLDPATLKPNRDGLLG